MSRYDDLFDDLVTGDSVFADKSALDPLVPELTRSGHCDDPHWYHLAKSGHLSIDHSTAHSCRILALTGHSIADITENGDSGPPDDRTYETVSR